MIDYNTAHRENNTYNYFINITLKFISSFNNAHDNYFLAHNTVLINYMINRIINIVIYVLLMSTWGSF